MGQVAELAVSLSNCSPVPLGAGRLSTSSGQVSMQGFVYFVKKIFILCNYEIRKSEIINRKSFMHSEWLFTPLVLPL
jgi:hypothetical protein